MKWVCGEPSLYSEDRSIGVKIMGLYWRHSPIFVPWFVVYRVAPVFLNFHLNLYDSINLPEVFPNWRNLDMHPSPYVFHTNHHDFRIVLQSLFLLVNELLYSKVVMELKQHNNSSVHTYTVNGQKYSTTTKNTHSNCGGKSAKIIS